MTAKTIELNAAKLGLLDLDFPSQAKQFSEQIFKQLSSDVSEVILDISGCVVLYSCANVFFDTAIDGLLKSTAPSRRLVVRTSLDYLSEAITIYELFRGCSAVDSDVDSATIADSLRLFCERNKLTVEIVVTSFSAKMPHTGTKTYKFG